jgi:hypothetical protein
LFILHARLNRRFIEIGGGGAMKTNSPAGTSEAMSSVFRNLKSS